MPVSQSHIFDKITTFFGRVKRSFERIGWPVFSERGLPIAMHQQIQDLTPKQRQSFYFLYTQAVNTHRKRRNIAIVLSAWAFFAGWFWVGVGLLVYLWYLKNRTIPETSQRIFQLATMSAAKPGSRFTPSSNNPYTRYGFTVREPKEMDFSYDPANLSVENLETGYLVDYDLKTWQVAQHEQYDWNETASEKVVTLVHETETLILHLCKEYNFTVIQRMDPLSIHAIQNGLEQKLLKGIMPDNILTVKDRLFYRDTRMEGWYFNLSKNKKAQKVTLWEYFDESRKQHLRIEVRGKNVKAWTGVQLSVYEFDEVLPNKTK
ncbi:DUF4178 domain-containing protein [Rapidithrix thailandica]|uniref:DUF4178 domain-containing protein n=1 Tax=Rapidithrix thailandica TaxID=413964 RepID=A0AAW9RU98_9BACT